MYNDQGSQYLVNIGIGNPKQNFTVALDTGSSDLWIPSVRCPKRQCPLNRFDPQRSTSFKNIQKNFNIQYGMGSVGGEYGQDSVYLEDAHVSDQVFGLAFFTQDVIYRTQRTVQANGILGLGYPSLSSNQEHLPFLFQLYQRSLIQHPIFAISLGSMDGWSGEITLGGVNEDKFEGPIHYVPVHQDQTYWKVGGTAVQLEARTGQTMMNDTFKEIRSIVLDTGTTLTYMDHDLIQHILRALPQLKLVFDSSSGIFMGDCNTMTHTGYHLQFLFQGGVLLNIPFDSLSIPLRDGYCMLGIAPWMQSEPSQKMERQGWIMLGDSVLKSTYLVFDMENHQVGFAETRNMSKNDTDNIVLFRPVVSASSNTIFSVYLYLGISFSALLINHYFGH